MLKRPMKFLSESITDAQLRAWVNPRNPVAISRKIDGYRCLCDDKLAYTSSLKLVTNIQKCLTGEDYDGLDGELVVGLPYCANDEDDVFNRTTGPVRRATGQPDFNLWVFDDWSQGNLTYKKRWIDQIKNCTLEQIPFIKVIEQEISDDPEWIINRVLEYEEEGYEGGIIRSLSAYYKQGRTTFLERNGYKRTSWIHDEAIIEECFEQMENTNEKTINELGLSTRSGHQENQVGKDTLGGYILRSKRWDVTFRAGTIKGATIASRKAEWELWKKRPEAIIGQLMKYKYKSVGSIDRPRQPIIQGVRDSKDMTNF
jgi:DNA ligase-1